MIESANLYLQYLQIKNKVDKAIQSVIFKSNYIGGKYVKKFENNFRKKNHSKYCISCGNGTDALVASIKSLGFKSKKRNEVITTSHSWFSTSSSITNAGGKVVFCDTEKDSFNISPEEIEKKITNKTSGIIVVHLFGKSANIKKIVQIAKKRKIWVIEDCAQAHFVKNGKKYLGNFGDIGTFSFYPGKNLGAMGDAGAIVTNKKSLYEKCIMHVRNGGKRKHDHFIEGLNSRLDGLQAAILNEKLPYIKKWNMQRKKIAKIYYRHLSNIKDLQLPQLNKFEDHGFHQFVVKIKNRNNLKKFLEKKKIKTLIHYPRILPLLPAYKYQKNSPYNFKNSYSNQNTILSLPIYPELKHREVMYIIKNIKDFFRN